MTKKTIKITVGIILLISIGVIIGIKLSGYASRPDGTTDFLELCEVHDFVFEKGYAPEEIEEVLAGKSWKKFHASWGEPDGMLSGFWGEIWYLDEEKDSRITLYYDAEGSVENIIIDSAPGTFTERFDLVPMVMVDGVLYLDTGYESTAVERIDGFDGEITSEVEGYEKPSADNQSNFGTGYGYQYGRDTEGTIEIYMNGNWRIFATEEMRQKIQFPEDDKVQSTLTSPPQLVVTCWEKQITAHLGTYSWEYQNGDGTSTGVESDSMHPLESKEYMEDLPIGYSYLSSIDAFQALLQFEVTPDEVKMRYWSTDHWNEPVAESEELEVQAIEVDFADGSYTTDYHTRLPEGNYVYEVIAKWSGSEAYSGTAHYSFYTVMGDYEMIPIETND